MRLVVAGGASPANQAQGAGWRQTMREVVGPGLFLGITASNWLRMLRQEGHEVDSSYYVRAASVWMNALANSALYAIEKRLFLPRVAETRVEAPIFVLGHARSGTTFLHQLLALDSRLAYPNVFQVYYPHTFLSAEPLLARVLGALMPGKRPQDDVAIGISAPAEDEIATCVATGLSPYMQVAFPRRRGDYSRFLTFRDAEPAELSRWKDALLLFTRKLAWKYGRPLVLKSPPHTARIRLLLELFPDARFVHVRRHPFRVYQSCRHLEGLALRSFALQRPTADHEESLLAEYRQMYEAYFEDRKLIPAGRLHELAFEDLKADPLSQLRGLYRGLGLPGFDKWAREPIEQHLSALAGYRLNGFPELPVAVKRRVHSAWRFCFDAWGYRA
jgi:hypothetical protein